MLKKYEDPTVNVTLFAVEDVITASGDPEGDGNEGGVVGGGGFN